MAQVFTELDSPIPRSDYATSERKTKARVFSIEDVFMSKPAKTILVFGTYLVLTGIILLSIPNVLLASLRIEPTEEPWIRVLGAVVSVLGCYYITAARKELTDFFQATVWGRTAILILFVGLALMSLAPAQLVLFGIIDFLGALWTQIAMRSSASTA